MRVSVVICTYTEELYGHLTEAAESILEQSYDDVELILVVDGKGDLCNRVQADWGDIKDVVVLCNDENLGVSQSRNRAAETASGDIVAFMDDDAIADEEWIETLVDTYKEHDALAVGGRMEGVWVAGRPWYLPEEFNWLVGVTHKGFAEPGAEIRNTFESNLSFRRDIFLDLDGFDPELGPTLQKYGHSEGAEIGARLRAEYHRGVVYAPCAAVRHKVFEHRIRLVWLIKRAFEQGRSKRTMKRRESASASEEYGYLRSLFGEYIPQRLWQLIRAPSLTGIGQLVAIVGFTTLVGFGYLYETVREVLSLG